MAIESLFPDFRELLRWFGDHGVKYLLVGGYAVGFHGYVRPTGDLDLWISADPANADAVIRALAEFGFGGEGLDASLFTAPNALVRMGLRPFQIEILTSISGVTFEEFYATRIEEVIDGVEISLIDLGHLNVNKKASGRLKDLADLDYLP